MKIEIKDVKYISGNNYCFQAVVTINGCDEFVVSNSGFGGPNGYSRINGGNAWDKVETLEKQLESSLDAAVNELVLDHITRIEASKMLRNVTYIKKDGSVYVMAYPNTPLNIERLKKKEWWQEDSIVLNELGFEDAVEKLKQRKR